LISAFQGSPNPLSEFLIGRRHDNSLICVVEFHDALQRIEAFRTFLFIPNQPDDFFSVLGEKGTGTERNSSLSIAVTNFLAGGTEHHASGGLHGLAHIRLMIKEPMTALVQGLAFRASRDLAWAETRLVGIRSVEFRQVASSLDTASALSFG
jgi:hypothetical protein